MTKADAKLIAFYLPQFHQIAENDAAWGKGFTEWTNVRKCKAKFPGHLQPLIPDELGYYDLSDISVMKKQIDLAKEYGIYAFCFYHYWFNEKLLLEKPLHNFLESEINFPFCLCWANENWSKNWDGGSREIIIEQKHSLEDDYKHFDYFLNCFKDPRYIRIENKPVLLVYRESLLENSKATVNLWKKRAKEAGFAGLYLCKVESLRSERQPPTFAGFDAAVEFQPDWQNIGRHVENEIFGDHKVFEYKDFVQRQILKPLPDYLRFPCVCPGWDNSARRQNDSIVIKGANPEIYRQWLSLSIEKVQKLPKDKRIVFINAWNEWAEGCTLEPDFYFKRNFLEQTKLALDAEIRQGDIYSYFAIMKKLQKDNQG